MSETVIILGAGASVEAGVPVMKDFLDVAERLLQKNDVEDSQKDFKAVFSAISALEPVHAKTEIDLNNLESVFAAFEMANLVKKLPPLNTDEVEALPAALRRLISKTIEKKLKFPVVQDRLVLPYPYQDFAHLLKLIAGEAQWVKRKVSIITFNYDIAIDCAVSMFGSPEYHLLRTGQVSGPNLFKLHGSLNWFDCETCKRIVSPNASQAISSVLAHAPEVYVRLETLFKTCPLCSKQLKIDPVIVPEDVRSLVRVGRGLVTSI
jgi:NAD-dependent SIR2 family protein deacetylase